MVQVSVLFNTHAILMCWQSLCQTNNSLTPTLLFYAACFILILGGILLRYIVCLLISLGMYAGNIH